jgi:hypothetical protein
MLLVNSVESKISLETKKEASRPERVIAFEIINNTDQHLFLTDEKLLCPWVEWDAATLEKCGKPVIIEKMGGTKNFVVNINVSMKTNSVLTWSGGCALTNFVLSFINDVGLNVKIDDKRYEAKIEYLPHIMMVGASIPVRITFNMNRPAPKQNNC